MPSKDSDDKDVCMAETKLSSKQHDDCVGKINLKTLKSDSKHGDDKCWSDSEDDKASTDEEGDSADDRDHYVDMGEIASRLGPMSARHRRSVVSSYVPVDKSWTPPVHAKSEQDEQAIRRSVRRNLLFSNVSEETLEILVKAMKYVAVKKGETIIRQGDTGDLFYIVDSGVCEVRINGRVVGELDGTSERNFFGELALLYDAPRAATIVASSDCECWSLDRITFKRVLMATTIKQRQLYLDFLDQVPIFSTLSSYERMIVADALRVKFFEANEVILEEGTQGDDFYIVEDGEVMCTKDGKEVSARLGSGDFFGELALIKHDVRMATVSAIRKTKCLVLDRKTFKRLLGPMQEHLQKRADLYELYMKSAILRQS
ncbi:TPA: hypothetical protein N0F65_002788 [Lagenidium giganteum]|uniref:cGMP-dependent protein kinase n=1 Tax=Lagenidium giganteum TaxID=4803 RepID=A0AAV2YQX6_9STRA|nr:TPA: hypothetical protein N0F65_002788 [Lagenidium giganteum]